jgi:hypothetical protein
LWLKFPAAGSEVENLGYMLDGVATVHLPVLSPLTAVL